jgi:hypothetical protein
MKDMQWKWNEYYKHSNNGNCDKKRVFNSSAEAHSFNKRAGIFLKGSQKREHLHVYRCNGCRQWHIGHEPTKEGKYREDRDG